MPREATILRASGEPFDEPVERRPGDFARHPKTGAPYVVSVDKLADAKLRKAELVELCAKHGIEITGKETVPQLKVLLGDLAKRGSRVQYGRPSGLGKQIENTTNLQKWAERAVALGLYLDWCYGGKDVWPELHASDPRDLDDPDARDILDAIAVKAKNRAQAGIAAERGTHGHELTEDHDNETDIIERITRGEELGLPPEVQYALVAAWAKMLGQLDVEMLAVEAKCVDDTWRQAGTLDRVCRLKRDTRFLTTGGRYVTLPAGWCGILDIKTGKLRLDNGGFVSYWHGYAVQLASYAQSVPYDPDTDTRGEWAFEIDQRWAIIAHLDILSALDGEAKCRLVLVDLEAGRYAGALCVAAREWEKRTDVFSIPTDDLCVSVPVEGFTEGPHGSRDHRVAAHVTDEEGPVSPPSSSTPAESAASASEPELSGHYDQPVSAGSVECDHAWKQVGRCAYCDRCGIRFQGKAPTTPEAAAAIAAVLDVAHQQIAAPTPPVVEQPAEEAPTAASSAPVAEHGSVQPPAADAQPAPGAAASGVKPASGAAAPGATVETPIGRGASRTGTEDRSQCGVDPCEGMGQVSDALGGMAKAGGPSASRARGADSSAWHPNLTDEQIRAEYRALGDGDKERVARMRDEHIATEARAGRCVSKRDATALALRWIAPFDVVVPPQPAAPPAALPERALRFTGDEGPEISEAAALEARGWMETLGDDYGHVHAVAKEAHALGLSFHVVAHRTRRRWEIYRGLACCARYGWSDELVRELLAAATDDDACRQPAVPLGRIVGLLDVAQAIAFADMAAQLAPTPALAGV